MSPKTLLEKNLNFAVLKTNFKNIGARTEDKIRDYYKVGDLIFSVYTDKLTVSDVVIGSVPFKGQCLKTIFVKHAQGLSHICPNNLVYDLDPNVIVTKNYKPIPIKVVVRRYLAGTGYRLYVENSGFIGGVRLPPGLSEFSRLSELSISPCLREVPRVDSTFPSVDYLVRSKVISQELWYELEKKAATLFQSSEQYFLEKNLILADTTYEFGFLRDEVVLLHDIHSFKSSRFWEKSTFESCLKKRISPVSFDKDRVRRWFSSRQIISESGLPPMMEEWKIAIGVHILDCTSKILGQNFVPFEDLNPHVRIERAIREYLNSST
jgi:phosphoribosylaminoimidazole-succinocarboxamide synthase